MYLNSTGVTTYLYDGIINPIYLVKSSMSTYG